MKTNIPLSFIALAVILVTASCSQSRYGSLTRKTKVQIVAKEENKQSIPMQEVMVSLSSDETEVSTQNTGKDQTIISTTPPHLLESNPVLSTFLLKEKGENKKTIAEDKKSLKTEKSLNIFPAVKYARKQIEEFKKETEVSDTHVVIALIKLLLIILLVFLIFNLILQLLPHIISGLLALIILILIVWFLLQIL